MNSLPVPVSADITAFLLPDGKWYEVYMGDITFGPLTFLYAEAPTTVPLPINGFSAKVVEYGEEGREHVYTLSGPLSSLLAVR